MPMMSSNDNQSLELAENMAAEEVAEEQQQAGWQAPQAADVEPADLQDTANQLRLLEALLFSSYEPLTLNQMAQFFVADTQLELLLGELAQAYEGRGVQLVQRGQGWVLRTAADLGSHLQIRRVEIKPLSKAATETLAIIGYHQPVTKGEIEQIRGVSISKTTMEILLQEGLIKPGKRRESPGRPLTWVTTQHFLDYFGLANLKDLPNLKELKDSGLLSVNPPTHLMPQVGEDAESTVPDEPTEDSFDEEALLENLDIEQETLEQERAS